jgi:hypothetical protein
MILVLKSRKDIKKIKEFLSARPTKKLFDAEKFCGKLKVDDNGLEIQHKLRDEWS